MIDYVKQYVNQIRNGQVIVSKKVNDIYEKLEKEKANEACQYYYDAKVGALPIEFIERFCKQSEGTLGAPIVLDLWQKAYIQTLFGWLDKKTHKRRFKETMLLVGRKNGKTTLLSAIALYMMIADGEGGAECYSVATKKDQAKKAFKSACNMVAQSPQLLRYVKKRQSDLYMKSTFSTFEPLASDSNTLDGLNTHLGIIDELHAIKDRNLYEVIQQSTSSREQPLLVMITTCGTVRECIYDDIYDYASNCIYEPNGFSDDRFLPMLYELDNMEEWTNETAWYKANPSLNSIKKLSYLRDKVKSAINDSKNLSGVLTKDFNVRVNGNESWLTFQDVDNVATFEMEELRGCYAVGGVDLSSTTDLTCATVLVMDSDSHIKCLQHYFIPNDNLETKIIEDKIPYDKWAKRGLITLCDGSRVDYSDVTNWFVTLRDTYGIYVLWTGYDTWGSQYWATEMKQNGFVLESVIQGAKTMSTPMKELKADFQERKINYNNNPILKWCLCNTKIKVDDNDNIRPVKKGTRQRIDGAVALIDAYVTLKNHYDDYINLL